MKKSRENKFGWKRIFTSIIALTLIVSSQTLIFNAILSNAFKTQSDSRSYAIVDTDQSLCYDDSSEMTSYGSSFNGQDSQFTGNEFNYEDNGDGTVSDLVTGLMWQQDPGDKKSFDDAVEDAKDFSLGGYTDWRLPSIKELYSLILFSGTDVSACPSEQGCDSEAFINSDYFDFEYGDTSAGERMIDSQYVSSTEYVSTTMNGDDTVFGVNFADGRIKGYPKLMGGDDKLFFVQYVRGNEDYGANSFINNGDGTINDISTGLMWSKADSGKGMDWEESLDWVQKKNEDDYLGYDDWRLPNVKELHSIVDYTRSPATTDSPAIDPIFDTSLIKNEGGNDDYPYFWTSTTHATTSASNSGSYASYIAFGEALGYMNGELMDVHGAGAQRSDPKTGNAKDFPDGHGPQGDVVRIDNYIRLVRGGVAKETTCELGEESSIPGFWPFLIILTISVPAIVLTRLCLKKIRS